MIYLFIARIINIYLSIFNHINGYQIFIYFAKYFIIFGYSRPYIFLNIIINIIVNNPS